MDFQAQSGFTIRHAPGVRFTNVKVNGQLIEPPPDGTNPANTRRSRPAGD